MRMMCGLMGVAVVPMAFYTIKNSGHSLHASILAAVLVLFGKTTAANSIRTKQKKKKGACSILLTTMEQYFPLNKQQ